VPTAMMAFSKVEEKRVFVVQYNVSVRKNYYYGHKMGEEEAEEADYPAGRG
jgi:hypothetical protein